jgi:Fur family transcriptional regulator, ferric uptake regulator
MKDSTDPRYHELMRRAESYWSARGGRMTFVRRIICQTLFALNQPIDAEELLRLVREKDNAISLSTVYRTLGALQNAGLIEEIKGRNDEKNYSLADHRTNATSHIVCSDCGQVIPVENPCLALRESSAARAAGFLPSKITLRFDAACAQFHKTGHCEQKDLKNL